MVTRCFELKLITTNVIYNNVLQNTEPITCGGQAGYRCHGSLGTLHQVSMRYFLYGRTFRSPLVWRSWNISTHVWRSKPNARYEAEFISNSAVVLTHFTCFSRVLSGIWGDSILNQSSLNFTYFPFHIHNVIKTSVGIAQSVTATRYGLDGTGIEFR